MSLDISLVIIDKDGDPTEVFWANITHNLGQMAVALDLYDLLWRPEENGIETAEQLIERLNSGIARLEENPNYYSQYDADNKWGTVEQFTPWLENLLEACRKHPEAKVESWR